MYSVFVTSINRFSHLMVASYAEFYRINEESYRGMLGQQAQMVELVFQTLGRNFRLLQDASNVNDWLHGHTLLLNEYHDQMITFLHKVHIEQEKTDTELSNLLSEHFASTRQIMTESIPVRSLVDTE